MKSIQIKPSLFFMLHDYFVYDNIDNYDDIRNELIKKMEKMQLHMLYTNSKTAPTEEEREAAKAEYLQMVGVSRKIKMNFKKWTTGTVLLVHRPGGTLARRIWRKVEQKNRPSGPQRW